MLGELLGGTLTNTFLVMAYVVLTFLSFPTRH